MNVFAARPAERPAPHARWIRALAIAGFSNAEIRQRLLQDSLPCPNDAALNAVRSAWPPPPGFTATSMSHRDSVAFLCSAGVYSMFHDRAAEDALAILRSAKARELIEAALLCGVPLQVILAMALSLHGFRTTQRAVELYRQVFFDTGAFSRTELRLHVHERVQLAVAAAAGMHTDEVTMRRAVMNDARVIALAVPSSQLAWKGTLLALGVMPGKAELGEVVDELEHLSVVRAGQALLRGGRDDERRADLYISVLGKLRAIRGTITAPQTNLANELTRVRIEHAPARQVSVADLVGGGDTVAAAGDDFRAEEREVEHAKSS